MKLEERKHASLIATNATCFALNYQAKLNLRVSSLDMTKFDIKARIYRRISTLQLATMQFAFSLLLCFTISHLIYGDKVKVGYFPNWTKWRPGIGKYGVADIDASQVTHVIYAFINFKADASLEVTSDVSQDFKDLKKLKKEHPEVKVVLSVGGWNAGPEGKGGFSHFITIAKSEALTKKFAQNAANLVKENGFDGFDIDWEYPNAGTKEIYHKMIKVFRETLDATQKGLELTAAVPAAAFRLDAGYDLAILKDLIDYFYVMTYDFHGPWESVTGVNAPMQSKDNSDVETGMMYFVKKGVPKEKVIMGLASYGKTWKLTSPSQNTLGSAASGSGTAGKFTREAGMLAYYEIVDNGWSESFDDLSKTPYASEGNQFVSYDNIKSIEHKTKFVCEHDFGGIMLWDLSMDLRERSQALFAHSGDMLDKSCGGKTSSDSPSTTEKGSSSQDTTSTSAPDSSAGSPTTTSTTDENVDDKICESGEGNKGYFCHPSDCTKYIQCSSGRAILRNCAAGLFWDSKSLNCVWSCGC